MKYRYLIEVKKKLVSIETNKEYDSQYLEDRANKVGLQNLKEEIDFEVIPCGMKPLIFD